MEDIKFNHTLPIQLRFNDVDALGHVNNTVYFSFYDLGKTNYFEAVRHVKIDKHNVDVVIASIKADFLLPVFPKENIAVQTAVTEIGNKSFKLFQQVVNTDTKEVKCICTTVMVGFDFQTGMSKVISDEWKHAICEYEGRDDLIRSHHS